MGLFRLEQSNETCDDPTCQIASLDGATDCHAIDFPQENTAP
jgi:hypothetical protein